MVLPGPGRYLVVSSAEGWSPMSEIQEFDAHSSRRHLQLRDRLALAGRVAYGTEPLDGAMVSVTRPTGEVVGSVHTDAEGRYAMTLPPGGHNIITVVSPDQQLTRSRKVLVVATQSNTVDIDLAEEDMATVHYPLAEVGAALDGVTATEGPLCVGAGMRGPWDVVVAMAASPRRRAGFPPPRPNAKRALRGSHPIERGADFRGR